MKRFIGRMLASPIPKAFPLTRKVARGEKLTDEEYARYLFKESPNQRMAFRTLQMKFLFYVMLPLVLLVELWKWWHS